MNDIILLGVIAKCQNGLKSRYSRLGNVADVGR